GLDRVAAAVAARLGEAGVGPGDVVAVCTRRSPLLAASLIGTLRAGAVYLPIDPEWPPDRIAMLLEDAGARAVLVERDTLARVPGALDASTIILDEPGALDRAPVPAVRIDPESPAYVLYTSGSTGRPKGVLVPHRSVMAHARAIVPAFALGGRDRCLQFTSPSFDVSIEEMLPTWLAGGCVVLRSDAASTSIGVFLRELEERAITVVNIPSAFFTELAVYARETKATMPPRVRLVVVGGEKPSAIAYAAWRNLHPLVRFLNAYGPTEVTITSTYCDPVQSDVPADGVSELPIGRPLGTCRAYVLDTSGDLAPIGVPGELCLAGPQVALGYLGRRELTEERFTPDPFAPGLTMYRTGDLVRRRVNGDLEFRGRVDDQVKIRGFRIEPGEIEALLRADPRVRDAVVAARATRGGSTRLIAWAVPTDAAAASLDEGALRAICSAKLPSFMVPSTFVILGSLPLTAGGKVDKKALPEPEESRNAAGFLHAEGDLEMWIASLFCELLGRDQVSADESFFDLGGHSLLALRLLSKINARARDGVDLGVIFAHSTVRDLARALETGGAGSLPTLVPLNRAEPDAVPLFCICGVQLYARLGRAMEADRPVFGAFLPAEAEALSGGGARLDVPSMAAAYIDLIREQRPQGPYLLGGISFGGILAYEMAQQLAAQGETVALLALFDTILPRALHKPSPIERAREHLRRLTEDPRGFGEHMQERFIRHVARIAGPGAVARGEVTPVAAIDLLRDELFRSAAESYDRRIQPYDGSVALFRARDGLGLPGERVDWDLGWNGLIPEASAAHVVRGTHLTILADPGVFEIARTLRTHLRGLDARPPTRRTRRVSSSRISIAPGALSSPPPPSDPERL
nr:amino acid adenylation domain-containing protein [Myxococcota bacterium]